MGKQIKKFEKQLKYLNYEMLIVKGDDIIKYYNRNNQDTPGDRGGLWSSCMNYDDPKTDIKARQLQFYAQNPENCGLLILRTKGSDRIKGRALIWTTIDGEKFIDEVYANLPSDVLLYKNYATVYNCLTRQNGDSSLDLVIACAPVLQTLNKDNYLNYLDTFQYDIKDNLIKGHKYSYTSQHSSRYSQIN